MTTISLLPGNGFEFELVGVSPGQEIVDLAIWVAVDEPCSSLNREMRERPWQRVQEHVGSAPNGLKRPYAIGSAGLNRATETHARRRQPATRVIARRTRGWNVRRLATLVVG